MITKINVTNPDIHSGRQHNGYVCPLSFAIRRSLAPKYDCYVSENDVLIYNVKEAIVFEENGFILAEKSKYVHLTRLPNIAKSKTRHFDKSKNILPFVFELNIPEKFLRNTLDISADLM